MLAAAHHRTSLQSTVASLGYPINKAASLPDAAAHPLADDEDIGGPGKEFYVDGQNHPIEKQRDTEPGAWRIEVQPTEANTVDCFLHFIHVADAEQQRAPQVAD
ncbi:MAG: hypothetical protein R3C56_13470 [Pirellulaceae bacterium]